MCDITSQDTCRRLNLLTNERLPPISSCDWPGPVVSGRFWRPVLCREGEGAAAYQTKEYTPPSLACVGREVEVSVQHCAKPVFYLSTWGKS